MIPSSDHIEGFFAGLEHARRKAAEVSRGKDKAIEQEIVTLRLLQHVGNQKRQQPSPDQAEVLPSKQFMQDAETCARRCLIGLVVFYAALCAI